MYPSQFSISFRKTVFPGFLPGTLLFENERSAGKPDRGNCDLVSPPDKNYLFRFISRLSRLQRMPRLQASHKRFPRTLTQIRPPSTKRSREIVPPIAPLSLPRRKVLPEATSSIVALILPGQPSDYCLKRNLHTNFTPECTTLFYTPCCTIIVF